MHSWIFIIVGSFWDWELVCAALAFKFQIPQNNIDEKFENDILFFSMLTLIFVFLAKTLE